MNFLSLISVFLLGGVVITVIINSLLLRFSRTLGIRNKNDVTIRWSNESKPSLGGIAMFFTFIFSILAIAILGEENEVFDSSTILGLLAAGTLAFLIGIADDAYNTRPFLKILGQLSCGLLFVASDTIIHFAHIEIVDQALTVFWVVAIMNSLNMLDNMDGITATVSFFILTSSLVASLLLFGNIASPVNVILVAQMGGLIGFLYFNIHPSKMFMGDTGSQFLSLIVSFYSIHFLWNSSAQLEVPSWTGLLLALAAFTPAAVDTFTVVINRLRKGQSPMVGGKDHTTHHLVYKGLNDLQVWKVFLLMSIISFLVAFLIIYGMISGNELISVVSIPIFFVFFILLYRVTLKYHSPEQKENK